MSGEKHNDLDSGLREGNKYKFVDKVGAEEVAGRTQGSKYCTDLTQGKICM